MGLHQPGPTAKTADLGPLDILTPRELEVFYYLAAGMSAGDVARTLFRSEKTIGRHVENIHKKMGYTNRAQLVRDAVENGLVTFTSEEWLKLVDPDHAPE
jgi:DNA-binding NarL/FixJ family response regulator